MPSIEDSDEDQLVQGNVVFPRRRLDLEKEIVATTSAETALITISNSMVASLGFVGGEDLGPQPSPSIETNLLQGTFASLSRETTISSKYINYLQLSVCLIM